MTEKATACPAAVADETGCDKTLTGVGAAAGALALLPPPPPHAASQTAIAMTAMLVLEIT
ncbi:MAG: hypothetical protein JNK55_21935 [Rubrivivax sp.]|nr:hypothetical protein [Rubrivivax sp.]